MRDYEKQIMTLIKDKSRGIGLSQAKIAAELSVSLPTIKRWWAGKGVSLSILHKLCALLGVSLSQLLLEVEGGGSVYTYTIKQESKNNKKVLIFLIFLQWKYLLKKLN